MSTSTAVQEARKKMQLKRLEAKGKKDYPAFYAAQPQQVERARTNAEWRDARQAAVVAAEALEIATITGEGLEAAKETYAIASLVAERAQPGRHTTSAGLIGA